MGILETSPYNFENQKLKDEAVLISQVLTDMTIEESIIKSQRKLLTGTEGTLRNMKLFGSFFNFDKIKREVEDWIDPKYYFEEFIKLNSTNFWLEILTKANRAGITREHIPIISKGLPVERVADNLSRDLSASYGLSIQLASVAILRGRHAAGEINVCGQYNGSNLDDNLYRAFCEIAKIFPDYAKNPNNIFRRLEFLFPYFQTESSLNSILERNGVYKTSGLESSLSPLYQRFINSYGRVLVSEEYKKDIAIRFSPVTTT